MTKETLPVPIPTCGSVVLDETLYTYDEILKATTDYFHGDDLAASAWIGKYCLQDHDGNMYELTPDDMHKRLAKELGRMEKQLTNNNKIVSLDDLSNYGKAREELTESKIYDLIKDFKYIVPQGSIMSVLGNDKQVGSLSNCIVVDSPFDSYGGISYTDQQLAQLMKRRCGVGTDISTLRPAGYMVNNSARTSTGAISFMQRFSNTTREVAQGGRRGALMLTMDVRHPDIEDFAKSKQDITKLTGANISIRLTDEFMQAVATEKDFDLRFPVNSDNVIKTVPAKQIWDTIINCAHATGEPGLIFWDRQHWYSTSSIYPQYENVSTNPCFTGDTLVAVADGRVAVPFKQLAEDGNDIPVYCVDDSGIVQIRTMRRPRLTQKNQKLVCITLDNGYKIRCTENHKWYLSDGSKVQAKDLVNGNSLMISSKWQTNFDEMILGKYNPKSKNYWMINDRSRNEFEHRFIFKQFHNNINFLSDDVIHHVDYDGLNNNICNLSKMTKSDHDELHNICGDRNPMVFWWNSLREEDKNKHRSKMSEATSGIKNGNYSGIDNDEIVRQMCYYILDMGYSVPLSEMTKYAKKNNLHFFVSGKFRNNETFSSLLEKSKVICGYPTFDNKYIQRNYDRYSKLKFMGENVSFVNGSIRYNIKCKKCNKQFQVTEKEKNKTYCSSICVKSKDIPINKYEDNMAISFILDNNDIPKSGLEFKTYISNKYKISNIFKYVSFSRVIDAISNRFNLIIRMESLNDDSYRSQLLKNSICSGLCPINHRVESVEDCGYEDVYCGTVDEFHNFGIIVDDTKTKSGNPKYDIAYVSNCSEIAMQGGDSCRLMVVNLISFVKSPYKSEAFFDFDEFYKVTYEAQRLMDDIVELEIEYVTNIIDKIKSDPEPEYVKSTELAIWTKLKDQGIKGRRTGLGFTGLADTLASLNLKYDSIESVNMTDMISKCKCEAEWDSSIDMAIERGSFKDFDANIDETSEFIQMLKEELPEVYDRNKKFGRRNISISTLAPAGTVSMMTQTTSGLEPLYAVSYTRRKKVNPNDSNVVINETDDLGDSWTLFNVEHFGISRWKKATGKDDIEDSPYWNCTAPEINWKKRIEIQSAVQKYVTHSISSTINLPKGTTSSEVSEIYLKSWASGLKGITIYIDGSRDGIMISSDSVKKNKSNYKRRPEIVECDIHYSTIRGKEWIFFVGKVDGVLYEIFGGKKDIIHIPYKYKTGWIRKNGRDEKGNRTYDLFIESLEDTENQIVVKNLGSSFSPEIGSYTRLLSLMLRHDVPIINMTEQLHKTSQENDMFSFEKGTARVLKKYIKDGERSSGTCQECYQRSLKYEGGCVVCSNCGHSACK